MAKEELKMRNKGTWARKIIITCKSKNYPKIFEAGRIHRTYDIYSRISPIGYEKKTNRISYV